MSSVFISHSHNDKEIVRKLASDLAANGIDTWVDEAEIMVGDSLIEKINEGINQSDYILFVVSNSSVQSTWVQQEIRKAFDLEIQKGSHKILPVVVDDVKVPLFLRDKKYADISSPDRYDAGLAQLIEVLRQPESSQTASIRELINIPDLAKEVAKEVVQILNVDSQGIRRESITPSPGDSKLVFVIISFSPDMDPIFEGIQAAGQVHGLRVERVKDVPGDYRITSKILEMIANARLIVADLSHERPNVYFELGYARGIGKSVITTARENTEVHFDVRDWTCKFYNDSRTLERHLVERFEYELRRG